MFSQANKIRIFLIFLTSVAFAGCDIQQTEEGELPDVEVQGGQLPKYEVTVPEVEVKSKTVEVQVPDVDIKTPDEQQSE